MDLFEESFSTTCSKSSFRNTFPIGSPFPTENTVLFSVEIIKRASRFENPTDVNVIFAENDYTRNKKQRLKNVLSSMGTVKHTSRNRYHSSIFLTKQISVLIERNLAYLRLAARRPIDTVVM